MIFPLKSITFCPCAYIMSASCNKTVSTMEESGTAYVSCWTCTNNVERMDSVSGSWIENLLPFPCSEVMEISPPSDSILLLTTSNPTPRPDTSDISSVVLKPGDKMSRDISSSERLLDASSRSEEHTSELQSRGHLVCRLL